MRKLALPTAALLALIAVTACEPEDDADNTPVESAEAEESGDVAQDEPAWDSEQAIADIRTSLEEGAFPELANIEIRADDDDPGHVTVITAEDTPLLGDAGSIVGGTCEDVPELEQITVDHSGHGGEVLGPVDAGCND